MPLLFEPTWAEEMSYQCMKANRRCIKLISSYDWRQQKRAARILVRFMADRAKSAGEFAEVRRASRKCGDKAARKEARDPYRYLGINL